MTRHLYKVELREDESDVVQWVVVIGMIFAIIMLTTTIITTA